MLQAGLRLSSYRSFGVISRRCNTTRRYCTAKNSELPSEKKAPEVVEEKKPWTPPANVPYKEMVAEKQALLKKLDDEEIRSIQAAEFAIMEGRLDFLPRDDYIKNKILGFKAQKIRRKQDTDMQEAWKIATKYANRYATAPV